MLYVVGFLSHKNVPCEDDDSGGNEGYTESTTTRMKMRDTLRNVDSTATIMFGFHQSLCLAAGQFDPLDLDPSPDEQQMLHNPDIHGNFKPGKNLTIWAVTGFPSHSDEAKPHLKQLSVEALQEYIDSYAEELRIKWNQQVIAGWAYSTNITDFNSARRVNATLEVSSWARAQWKENISQFDLSQLHESAEHERLSRLFKAVEVLGFAALDDDKLAQRTNIKSDMTSIYSSAKICPFDKQNCDLKKDTAWSLDPELNELFRVQPEKENFEKLAYVWAKWRDASGKLIRQKFLDFVRLSNEAAIANKNSMIKNAGDLWLRAYESPTFREEMGRMYEELKPFYQELHAYVRHKLRQFYGEEKMSATGPIPAHVLGMYIYIVLLV
ncbi:unnamed protein product [Notodromas monacha]|uniref:Angiotensin-converting enzyme n=1 Tax=Notodromas monacha TaxID=399045 RepID=A0A7R9BHZ5_9CRUS|nr:unnamed protein product [Notodromas monacha]CAG0914791.1 unnamed protein product [Notodromas monacha]